MIAEYFRLQMRRIHRMVVDMGLHPMLNYSVIAALYLGFSAALFSQNPKALISYTLLAIFVTSIWNDARREDFLKSTFARRDYYLIRCVENLVTVFPFVLALCVSGNYLPAMGVLAMAMMMAISSFKVKWQIVIPTPFYRHPFEFIIGFRWSFVLFGLGYFLTYISIVHQNFGIGVFVIIAFSCLCSLYHSSAEDWQYIWIFAYPAHKFLLYKSLIATAYTLLLCLPVLMALIFAFPERLLSLMAFQALGLLILYLGVASKYTSYPGSMNMKNALLMLFSFIIPPMLLFTVPFFYIQAKQQLKDILS